MKTILLFVLFIIIYSFSAYSQSIIEMEIDSLTINAKKGIYWGLMNIPIKKAKIEKSLISKDRVVAKVKVIKEVNGVKIESTGYHNTNEMTILIYRSSDSLIKEGYIKKGDLETLPDDE